MVVPDEVLQEQAECVQQVIQGGGGGQEVQQVWVIVKRFNEI